MTRLADFIRQASAEAKVKYGAELGALGQLLSNAAGDYSTARGAAAGGMVGTQAAVNAARPFVSNAYQQAGGVQTGAQSLLSKDLAGLGSAADPYKQAAATEAAAAQARLATAGAAAQTDLSGRYVRAADTANYLRGKAFSDYAGTKSQIANRLAAISQESGSFAQGRVADLKNEADKLQSQADIAAGNQAVTIRGQDLSHADRQASIAARGRGKVSATGAKLNPPGQHATAREKIAAGLAQLANLDPGKKARHHTAPGLVAGAPAAKGAPIYVTDKTGKQTRALNPDGTPKMTGDLPAIPALGSWATIAADVYYDGHLSRANQQKLAQQGYSIKQLGLPTYAQWKQQHPRKPSNYGGGAGAGSGTG